MSQALEVYLIPHERDLKVFGCRHRELLRDGLRAAEERLAALDEEFDVEAEGLISHANALREILAGKTTREDDCGFVYGHANEVYCRVVGERLSNRHFSPAGVRWLNTMDEFFEQRGVPLRFRKLLFDRFPIPIETDSTPCGGFWGHQEIVAARHPLEDAIAGGAATEVVAAAGEVLASVDRAVKTPSSVIVGFFD